MLTVFLRAAGFGGQTVHPLWGRVRQIRQTVVQLNGAPTPSRLELGGAVLQFHLVHTPTTPRHLLLATPGLAPFALTSGDPAAIDSVVELIAGVTDVDLRVSLATLALFIEALK